ncbi:hypothetical protein PROFUN_07437 [Planoprotostelium fungivorum]|uniref:ATP synthase subunit d, mitochondrial n=1 Tax=Planoprotostelium fungivorum TaxID=1890364 RepID=A0A2P6NLE7_9EUKA|nr:hypothetical protein PROFUN_07437 [Planoprotostelium fungivorum]
MAFAAKLANPGPALQKVLETLSKHKRVQYTFPGASTKAASELRAQTAQFENWFEVNAPRTKIAEPDWDSMSKKIGADVTQELKLINQKARQNIAEASKTRVAHIENDILAPIIDDLESVYAQLLKDKEAQEKLIADEEAALEKYHILVANQENITTDDILKAYPHLLDEVIDDIAHSRWDFEANYPVAAAQEAPKAK